MKPQPGDGERSVMKSIDRAELEIKTLHHRLETLERNLQFRPMTMEERETMEKDVQDLKKVLTTAEANLKGLRNENRSSMMIAVVLMIATFLFYGLYCMIFGVKRK